MQDAIFTLRGRAAWAHDFNTDRNVAATFQTLPGASFVVNGAAQAHDAALTTASAEMKWLNGWSAAATFEGEFSSVTTSYAGKGVVRYKSQARLNPVGVFPGVINSCPCWSTTTSARRRRDDSRSRCETSKRRCASCTTRVSDREPGGLPGVHSGPPAVAAQVRFAHLRRRRYKSFVQYARPTLKDYGFGATLFVYSDFIGAGSGLSWQDLRALSEQGYDVQAHSKSHANLRRKDGESEAACTPSGSRQSWAIH